MSSESEYWKRTAAHRGKSIPETMAARADLAADEVVIAARALLDAIDANIDDKESPGKYTVPWAEATALREALAKYHGCR